MLTFHQSSKSGVEGQRLTKVDRSDDIVPVQKVNPEIGNAIRNRRSQDPYKMTQAELAKKVNAQANDIKTLESGQAIKNQALLNKVARVLKISPKTGKPLDEEPAKGSSSKNEGYYHISDLNDPEAGDWRDYDSMNCF